MRRREFITLVGGAAAIPLVSYAQEQKRRIGVLMGTAETDPDQKAVVSEFTQALADLGWQEGSRINIEYRWAAGDTARLQSQAAELGRLGLDAIFAQGTPATT